MLIIVPGHPVAKGRPRFGKGRTRTPEKTAKHERHIRDCFMQVKQRELIEGPIRLTITFSMRIPESWSKKKKLSAVVGDIRPTSKPDIDNLVKMIDALNGLAFKDDSQIVEVKAVKKYGTPETIILIERVD